MIKALYFLRAALSGLKATPFVHFVAALIIAVAIFSVGLARFGLAAADAVLAGWGAEVEVTLWLAEGADAKAIAGRLSGEDRAEVRSVTAEEALARLRADLGESGAVLANLPKNPLPASLEVRPAAGARSAAAMASLAEKWKEIPGVDSVEYGREWVERLEGLGRTARGAGALILLVVLLAAVVVVSATLQLAVHARRGEIEIQKLVGATDLFVKAPFVLEGIIQGLLGSGLACAGLWACARWLGPRLAALGFSFEGIVLPPLLEARGAVELCVAGIALGLLGSLLAVRRFLRV